MISRNCHLSLQVVINIVEINEIKFTYDDFFIGLIKMVSFAKYMKFCSVWRPGMLQEIAKME